MAKFIKSLFNPTEKRHSKDGLEENREDFTPPLDSRRKLSISRSGRMKQANKKRSSLTLDTYGENLQQPEKALTKEYHVHGLTFSQAAVTQKVTKEKNKENKQTNVYENDSSKTNSLPSLPSPQLTPEQEIDSAFEILDKT